MHGIAQSAAGALMALSAAGAAPGFAAGCQLASNSHGVKHIVYIQFDNVHLRRDNPNVQSDLEQMPNLLRFMEREGTLLTNHHTPLITHTWLGLVGPGVREKGRTDEIFSDHTDIRPTIMSLARLKDDYAHDGRVLFEVLTREALPDSLRDDQDVLARLAAAYKQINAPLGKLGLKTLTGISTRALKGDDATYAALEDKIVELIPTAIVCRRVASRVCHLNRKPRWRRWFAKDRHSLNTALSAGGVWTCPPVPPGMAGLPPGSLKLARRAPRRAQCR